MGKHEPTAADHQRHAEIYATPGLPTFQVHVLDDVLLAGRNPLTSVDVAALLAKGVTHVLDLREDREWRAPGRFGREAVEDLERAGMRHSVVVQDMAPPTRRAFDEAMGLEARRLITYVADDLVREATDPPATGDVRWEGRYPGT